MKKDQNLYFIPILAEAFDQEDRTKALKAAIHEIIQLGNRPEYRKGFEQFIYFLASGQEQLLDKENLDSIKNTLLDNIMAYSEIDHLVEELLQKMGVQPDLILELYSEEELLATRPMPSEKNKAIFTTFSI